MSSSANLVIMRKVSVLLILTFATLRLAAQDCNCSTNFNAVVSQVKNNYAGYNDKIAKKRNASFEDFTNKLKIRSEKINNIDSCYVLMRTWTNFFQDQHLRVQLDWKYRQQFPQKIRELNRQFPKKVLPPAAPDSLTNETSLTQLDAETILFRLPSFEWSEKQKIDSLTTIVKKQFKETPYWIIDIRGNGGGTDYAFSSLLPFIYTNPIVVMPDEYWASQGNIEILKDNLKADDLPADGKKFLTNVIKLMESNIGDFVNPSGQDKFITSLDSVYAYPKKIGILIDRDSKSSAESFLLMAKQSKKVIVFGENSAGSLDYANTQFFNLPCKTFNLIIAISRSKRLPLHPIDNIGITPDITIPNSIPNKVNLVLRELKIN